MTEGLDLSTLSIKELKEYLKENNLNISVHSRMKKDELLELIFDELGKSKLEEKEKSNEDDSHAKGEARDESKEGPKEDETKNIPSEAPKRDNTLVYAYTLEEVDIRTDKCRELVIKGNQVIEEILIAEDVPQIVKMKMKRAMYERRNG